MAGLIEAQPWTYYHHFPQGDAAPTQASVTAAFLAALAEQPAWVAAGSAAGCPPSMPLGAAAPCGFIALATASALSCAPDAGAGESRVHDPAFLLRGINAVIRAVLAERARILGENPAPGELGKTDAEVDETPESFLGGMLGRWEIVDALRALASGGGGAVRLCYLRNVYAADDDFWMPRESDPPWVVDFFAQAALFRGDGAKHFMQHGGELLTLEAWAARVLKTGAAVSPPFLVDDNGHFSCARVELATLHAHIFDSYHRNAAEPLNEHVQDVVRALKDAGAKTVQ